MNQIIVKLIIEDPIHHSLPKKKVTTRVSSASKTRRLTFSACLASIIDCARALPLIPLPKPAPATRVTSLAEGLSPPAAPPTPTPPRIRSARLATLRLDFSSSLSATLRSTHEGTGTIGPPMSHHLSGTARVKMRGLMCVWESDTGRSYSACEGREGRVRYSVTITLVYR